jgi:ribonuclease HII
MIAGVDEAGRVQFLGPHSNSRNMYQRRDIPKLVEIGVKDSKLFNTQKTETLRFKSKIWFIVIV